MRAPIKAETIQRLKSAITSAKDRIDGNGNKLAFSAILVLGSFGVAALFAPLAYKLPGLFQTILLLIPFGLLIYGVWLALDLLLNISKEQKQSLSPELQTRGTIARGAIMAAMGEIEDASLLKKGYRDFEDCLSGKFFTMPVVIIQCATFNYCVIRVKTPFKGIMLINSKGKYWHYGLPTKKKLVPLTLPLELNAEGWCFDSLEMRDSAQDLAFRLTPALKTSAIGGEMPFVYAQNRNLILAWESNDVGSCTLIAYEFARLLQE